MNRYRRFADAGIYAFLGMVGLLVLVPIFWILSTSLKPTAEILVTPTSLFPAHPTLDHFGVALSGGGIRSATFCLGVFQALAQLGRLAGIDYISTVSGGGYFGAFLGRLYRRSEIQNGEQVLIAPDPYTTGSFQLPEWL